MIEILAQEESFADMQKLSVNNRYASDAYLLLLFNGKDMSL